MGDKLTMLDVARLTGYHKNTVNNYRKRGLLKFELIDGGKGKQVWVIDQDILYDCGVPQILERLGPQEVEVRLDKREAERSAEISEAAWGAFVKLNEDLLAAREALAGLRSEVPALREAREERDRLREDLDMAKFRIEALNEKLEEARVHSKWSYRRRMAKGGKI